MKNRSAKALFQGYRDFLLNLAVTLPDGTVHVCELQVHYRRIKVGFAEVSSSRVEYSNIYESLLIFAYFSLHAATTKLLGIEHKSHETYEFFRSYFMGNMGPAAKMYVSFSLCSFPLPSLVRGT